MSRKDLFQFILASCLCGAGALGFVRVWANPVAASGERINAAADASGDAMDSGVGLKLSQNLVESNARVTDAITESTTKIYKLQKNNNNIISISSVGPSLGAGFASWYGPRFQGRRTASGERFDRYALTAAHKTLPFGSRVVVSNPRTGKQIVVRINDRGPYIGNRVLDLSEAAAHALGLKASGHDWVVMNAVLPPPASSGSNLASYPIAGSAETDAAVSAGTAQDMEADKPVAEQATPLAMTATIALMKPAPAVTTDTDTAVMPVKTASGAAAVERPDTTEPTDEKANEAQAIETAVNPGDRLAFGEQNRALPLQQAGE